MNQKLLSAAIGQLNAALQQACGEGLNDEQRDCLLDPARREETLDMLDDMKARIGIPAVTRVLLLEALCG